MTDKKVIVITGTSSGFGKLAVAMFANSGWNVVATVRKNQDLQVHEPLAGVKTLLLDVNDESADLAFGKLAQQQFGRVDALINNAGYFQAGPLEGSSMEQIHRQFQTNVFGLIALNKAFIPIFRTQRSGIIINVSSISAEAGFPYTSAYEASKGAVAMLSEGLHAELAEFGVVVKALFPGNMKTTIFQPNKVDRAQDVPKDYLTAWEKFNSLNTVRSNPQLTADVMFNMVNDGNTSKVRYYSGPDGQAIPRAKKLLGQDWFWEAFSQRNLGQQSLLWQALMSTPVDNATD